MDEKSENSETTPEKGPTIPEEPIIPPKKEEEPQPQPKARGRPRGAKDAKPRIKRVPIQQEEEPPPRVKAKKEEPKEQPKEEPKEEPPVEEESEEDAPLPPPKSPRTLHRERVQHTATERRRQARDRQDHFERILDNFMGF